MVSVPGYSFFFAGALVAFAAYALMVAFRLPSHEGALGLLELFADTVLFLVLANNGVGHTFGCPRFSICTCWPPRWLSTARVKCWWWWESASSSARWAAVSCCCNCSGRCWWPACIACAFAVHKTRLQKRAEELSSEAGSAQTEAKLAREDERQRIASDFHDGPLQSFISLQMRLEIVRKLLERDLKAGMAELRWCRNWRSSQVRELRAFLHSMRPVEMEGANLSLRRGG